MSAAASRTPVVYLYVPISAASEYRPLEETGLAKARAAVKRCRDRLFWSVLRRDAFDYHAWRTTEYTNRGDIAIRQAIRQILERKLGYSARFVELDWGTLDEAAVAKINEHADLFVICGGGYVSADAATGRLSRVIEDVALLPNIRCPVAAFAIGYNCVHEVPQNEILRELPPETVFKLKQLASSCGRIASRDRMLADIFADVAGTPVPVIGDPAFFLDDGQEKSMPLPASHDGDIRIGINLALHGPITADIFRSHLQVYTEFLKHLQRTQRVTFHYFVHCETERIAISLLRKHGIRLHVVDLPPRRMIATYRQMDAVICQMLHASILASNAGVPSLNIGYDTKNLSFYELMDLPWLCIPHEQVVQDVLAERFVSMMTRREEIISKIAQRKAQLSAATDLFADSLAEIARSPISPAHPQV